MGFFKSHKRSKWCKCFEPETHDDFPFEPVRCLANAGKENHINVLRKNYLMSLSDGEDNMACSFPDGAGEDLPVNNKKSKSRRNGSLSRAFKALLFPIDADKKNRSRKTEQEKSFLSNSNGSSNSTTSSSKLGKMLKSFRRKKSSSSSTASMYKDSIDCSLPTTDSSSNESSIFSSDSVTPSSSLTASRTSSIASNSRSPSERKKSIESDFKQSENKPNTTISSTESGHRKIIIGLFFLLVCLAPLVLCGKALAVFCTSACLFFVPCRFNKGVDHHQHHHDQFSSAQNDGVESIDSDSDEHKKKVILEGLLERNRTTRVLI